jgi:hypothetical protein
MKLNQGSSRETGEGLNAGLGPAALQAGAPMTASWLAASKDPISFYSSQSVDEVKVEISCTKPGAPQACPVAAPALPGASLVARALRKALRAAEMAAWEDPRRLAAARARLAGRT